MWGKFIIIFALIWGLQFLLTQLQVKQYQSQIKEFTKRKSGYLGTGYYKKRLGTGALVLLVCDEQLEIVEAKIMKGITVFARFRDKKELIGKSLLQSKDSEYLTNMERNALVGAVQMIEKEINKRKGNEAWIS
ncbi:transcriptional regulator GutM [Ornithinibacillus bavariensis]|uniref:Glucitol operon activator protein n=1 Tax=Ornithinibacillus bavariensis TaxID=545502 RepID=A0A919X8S8_9BACI|nr:transcriptional regulator GutM [Ornithinibacillus bavariensis]GIO26933.1 glucitol operon activator protein [Ornithinibacillus bavariensis]